MIDMAIVKRFCQSNDSIGLSNYIKVYKLALEQKYVVLDLISDFAVSGDEIRPFIESGLTSDSNKVRHNACIAIRNFAKYSNEEIQLLQGLLHDTSADVAKSAITTLMMRPDTYTLCIRYIKENASDILRHPDVAAWYEDAVLNLAPLR